ncbi:MAG: Fe-S cluster assembly protein SufB [Nitrososphaerota archaeon]|jgi:Fe-S cluster assembly protein SufB|nr:Fe-S cluster assembly protein SufB [Nitrososphaerota archaeon]MDG7044036.1 Fe-S cluster assembly protein SufB [Nitrososphaerota archaeon]MDG7050949.1 Fe-S cluster assembly protein SufB [Nitrososphaerota archaeon]
MEQINKRPDIKDVDYSPYDFKVSQDYVFVSPKGLNEELVRDISTRKNEPDWMLQLRLKAYNEFISMPLPRWGPSLSDLNFENIIFYAKPMDKQAKSWNELPASIKNTFDRLGLPEAERNFLAGVGAQFESDVVYHKIKKELEEQGVIFSDMDGALREYGDIVKKYYGTVIPIRDNKFAALTYAVWSGGSFVYVPKGVKIEKPLNAYFRLNAPDVGNFERTLIIAEDDSDVHYIEGCTAPVYTTSSLHSGVVEIVVKKNAHVRYTTIQNWSKNVYNLVTQRAQVDENGRMEWIDGNIGSKVTMKYPSIYLRGKGSRGEILSVAYANNQNIDSGGKIYHLAPNTSSKITSKGISKNGGSNVYRGMIYVARGATGVKSAVRCDALILDMKSKSDTYPYLNINENDATTVHEASVGKIGEEQMFYLRSRGLSEAEAQSMIVMGFLEPFTKELPLDFAVEMNRLIDLDMTGAIG